MDSTTFLIYAGVVIAALIIIYFFYRYVFAIDRRVDQNEQIINLLDEIKKELQNKST